MHPSLQLDSWAWACFNDGVSHRQGLDIMRGRNSGTYVPHVFYRPNESAPYAGRALRTRKTVLDRLVQDSVCAGSIPVVMLALSLF